MYCDLSLHLHLFQTELHFFAFGFLEATLMTTIDHLSEGTVAVLYEQLLVCIILDTGLIKLFK